MCYLYEMILLFLLPQSYHFAFQKLSIVHREFLEVLSFRKLIESHHIPIVQKMTYGSKTCSMIKQNFAAKYVTTASLRMNKASQTCPTSESFFKIFEVDGFKSFLATLLADELHKISCEFIIFDIF